MRIEVAVSTACDGWFADAARVSERAARAALAAGPARQRLRQIAGAAPSAALAVVLADDVRVRALNAAYRDRDAPTNVLSFEDGERDPATGEVMLGDVVLARETVLAEADAQGKRPLDHLAHLVVHGVLHLIGYDHQDAAEAATMEELERGVLAGLGIADPYAEPAGTVEER
jgi:probable rRNA maturation factor